MDVTVCIGTYGSDSWEQRGWEALWGAYASTPTCEPGLLVVGYAHHGETLAQARNACAEAADTEWLCFLDADDELEAGYFQAMARGSADLRAPAVRYVREGRGREPAPQMPRVAGHRHACTADCLPAGNWCVIGTLIRREAFLALGGFHEWPVYEDWDLFLRAHLAGASVEAIPDAVYRAEYRRDSRNRQPHAGFKNRIHEAIVAANFPPEPLDPEPLAA